jgi:Asp-tRNA(Asn)/Glu-tRNA(Gln) amidotransferase A subunit family amidase
MDDPLDPFASATDIAAAVRSRSIDAVEITRAALGRIDAMDGELNAVPVVLDETALSDARQVDGDPERRSGPLAGVPVVVKDHVWVAGAPATNGSLALRGFVPVVDCVAVARLRAAGAVIVGKTNNPEFCYRGDTRSPVYGLTRNPYDLGRTPGGSSGGSAAAVSAGLIPLAVGTDASGSIRCPSAFCGIVGHKPTHGLVPTRPGFAGCPTLSVHGPMGRNMGDVATMLGVMAGEHSADPSTFPVRRAELAAAGGGRADLTDMRVAVSVDFGFAQVDNEVKRVFADAVSDLGRLGCELTALQPPTTNPVEMSIQITAAESFASEGYLLAQESELTSHSVSLLRLGEAMSASDYLYAQERRRTFTCEWGEFFEQVDLVISPGCPVAAARIEDAEADTDEEWWGVYAIANLTGQPATVLPCGLTNSGLPVGIQVMGRRYSDAAVLSVAATIERTLPRLVPPAPFGNREGEQIAHR